MVRITGMLILLNEFDLVWFFETFSVSIGSFEKAEVMAVSCCFELSRNETFWMWEKHSC